MTCQEFVELATEYLEDAIRPELRRRFDEHIADCPGCSTYLDQMRETIRLAGRLDRDDLSPPAREALLEAFRHRQSR